MAKHKNILTRYLALIVLMVVVGISIIVKAGVIMFGERDYWHTVAERYVSENVPVKATRGNILSADGQLMASSLPEYKIYMDFKAGGKEKDFLLMAHLDEICKGMHRILPDRSVAEFKATFKKGRKLGARHYPLYPYRISFTQFQEIKQLPVLERSKNKSGLIGEPFNQRKKPFGSLARRTLGEMFPSKDSAISGLELSFDSLLRGTPGIAHRQKVMSANGVLIVNRQPVDGCDIISTIDVDMQDIAEKALMDKLKEINADWGTAVLMEVATGDVKAIVNLTKTGDSLYYEKDNWAVGSMMEPGSTFKTASIMVAMEDGYITPDYEVDTGNGIRMMYRRPMRDHNWHRGGYGKINVSRILEVSSNVGVSSIIDQFYHDDPQRFVNGLKRMSLDKPLHLQVPGEGTPYIKGPKERKNFSLTSLPWMSIGYETMIPPINILTFYNAIANNGTMVRPRFVTAAMQGDEVVEEYPVEVINPKICSDTTLTQIRTILRRVVSQGLAKPAGSKQFSVSGKTGTAQVSQGASGYKSGTVKYLVSFCGFFPSEHPKYSMIVSIRIPHGPASGGLMAGSVFSRIAERVYAKDLTLRLEDAIDSTSVVVPTVKDGDLAETETVLQALQVKTRRAPGVGDSPWATFHSDSVAVSLKPLAFRKGLVPNVRGMGAKDAVYALEQSGLRVRMEGVGHVYYQSILPGSRVSKGAAVVIRLRN